MKRSASGADSLPSASLSTDSPLEGVTEVAEESEGGVEAEEAEVEDEEPKEQIIKTEVTFNNPPPLTLRYERNLKEIPDFRKFSANPPDNHPKCYIPCFLAIMNCKLCPSPI